MSGELCYQLSYKSSNRTTSQARRSDQKRTSELVTFPELWGTFVSEADERQMDQWRRETEEMLAGTPSYTRGQSVRDNSSQATSSCRKRSREDDHCTSYRSTKRQRRSVSRDRAVSRDRVSRERGYDASRSRTTYSHGRQYRANGVYSYGYSRPTARVYVNRNHYRFSNMYNRMSKGRAWAIVTIIVVAAIVALGVGLGIGLNKQDDDNCDCNGQGTGSPNVATTGPPTQSPLWVEPSVSIEGDYRFAAIAPDAPKCAKIGTRLMAVDGGSAIDAAIATILCVGVYNAHSCGIGGGHFLTYYNRETGNTTTILAREMAPVAADEYMYTGNVSSRAGGMSIGVPGEVRGLYEAHKLGGKLPWSQLFQPAIQLSREGVPVGKALLSGMSNKEEFFTDYPKFKDFITNPATGEIYKEGEIFKRPKLATTLEIIANEGPDAFYNGSLTKDITDDIAEAGGIITGEDLANYHALVYPALKLKIHGDHMAYSPPPPSSGAVYLAILNILNGFQMDSSSFSTTDKAVLTFHRITEAFKHAYSLRTQLGDYGVGSETFKEYVQSLVQNMTMEEFGEEKRSKINDSTTYPWQYYEPIYDNSWDHGTAHLSVLGPNGDAVGITSTVNLHFGSKVIGSRTGIIFNDEMDDFATPNTTNYFGVPASPANFIEPGKRPLSSMCPSIVVGPNGDVELVVGASGGTRITTAAALVTMETLWFDWDVKRAVDYPRIHHQLIPERLNVGLDMPQALIDGLAQKGHTISQEEKFECIVQAIRQHDGRVTANSDFRKDGIPDGY